MSAYLVTPRTIKAIVQAIKESDLKTYHGLTREEAAELLYDENVKSLHARYGDKLSSTEKGDYLRRVKGKGWEYIAFPNSSPLSIIKINKCWQYQSCEHEGHEETKAWKLTDAIISRQIDELPGYDQAPWGLDDEPETEIISLFDLANKINRGKKQ